MIFYSKHGVNNAEFPGGKYLLCFYWSARTKMTWYLRLVINGARIWNVINDFNATFNLALIQNVINYPEY